MKTRVKLLLAGMILAVAAWRPAPAEAWCNILPFVCDSEEQCEQTCYGGGCYSYEFSGVSCTCS
jgi:hypothetical protein